MSDSPPGRGTNLQRKARESTPHALAGALVSTEARPTVSGYLPYYSRVEWTHRESNPGRRHAKAVSFRWTMGPSLGVVSSVDRRGVEPRSPPCESGVVPLDQQPSRRPRPLHGVRARSARESTPD